MLRNIFCAFATACAFAVTVHSQVPTYRFSKFDTTGAQTSSNVFSNTNYASRCQSIYYPVDFPLMPAGTITAMYFRIGNNGTGTASATYPEFTAKIGYTADSFFRYWGPLSFDTFKTGLTTVFGPVSFTVTGTDSIGKWVRVPLNTPFYYNKEAKFVVEFSYGVKTNPAGFDIMTSNRAPLYTPNRNRNLAGHRDSIRESYGAANITLMDLGFDMQPNAVNEIPSSFSAFGLFPNPSTDGRFNVSFESIKAVSRVAVMLINVFGQQVWYRSYDVGGTRFFREINPGDIPKGIYTVHIDADGSAFTQKLVVR